MHPQVTTDATVEEWRPVPLDRFGDVYFVSNLGNVRRKNRAARQRLWKPCRPYAQWHGYLLVRLQCKPLKKSYSVHRLVARAFLGEPPSSAHEVNHKDGNKTNNRADNLEWVTRRENLADADRRGLTRRGMQNGRSKLTEDAVRAIRASTEPLAVLAARYGVNKTNICSVRHRRIWKHVP